MEASPVRVLIADDNLDDLKMFSMYLEALGCEVFTCSDATQCCALIETHQPQVVFLDIAMPKISGLEIAQQLRASKLPPLLLVARTGYGDEATRTRCLDAGFNMVLVKPADVDQIKRLLETARSLVGA